MFGTHRLPADVRIPLPVARARGVWATAARCSLPATLNRRAVVVSARAVRRGRREVLRRASPSVGCAERGAAPSCQRRRPSGGWRARPISQASVVFVARGGGGAFVSALSMSRGAAARGRLAAWRVTLWPLGIWNIAERVRVCAYAAPRAVWFSCCAHFVGGQCYVAAPSAFGHVRK